MSAQHTDHPAPDSVPPELAERARGLGLERGEDGKWRRPDALPPAFARRAGPQPGT